MDGVEIDLPSQAQAFVWRAEQPLAAPSTSSPWAHEREQAIIDLRCDLWTCDRKFVASFGGLRPSNLKLCPDDVEAALAAS